MLDGKGSWLSNNQAAHAPLIHGHWHTSIDTQNIFGNLRIQIGKLSSGRGVDRNPQHYMRIAMWGLWQEWLPTSAHAEDIVLQCMGMLENKGAS